MPRSNQARAPQLSLRSRAHEPQLLSLHVATTEACVPRARVLQQEKPLQSEAHPLQGRVSLLTPTRESPRTATNTQCSQKKKKAFSKIP